MTRSGQRSDAAVETVSGLSAGIATTLVSHPLDLVKTRLQVSRDTGRLQIGDTFRLLRDIKRLEGGYRATYRGLVVNLVGNSASWGLYFLCYDQAKKLISRLNGRPDLAYHDYFWASGLAGALTAVCTNPIWVLKTRMLATSAKSDGAYQSSVDGARQIYKADGIRGFYRGLLPSFFGVGHGALQFTVYEELKQYRQRRLAPGQSELSSIDFVTLSGLSKLVAGVATYPYQVLRARLQTYEAEKTYSGLVDVVSQISRHEGLRGFYRGLMPNMLRVLPSTCVTFLVYENTKGFLAKR